MEDIKLENIKKCYKGLAHLCFNDSQSLGRTDWKKDRDMEDWRQTIQAVNRPFLIDQIKIDESKGDRRSFGKTQVFPNPINPFVRHRASHTKSVCSIISIIADFLGHNVDLAIAGAKGHDIGHVIYGHLGEDWFTKKISERYKRKDLKPVKFKHALNGVVVAQRIERKGLGLNLSYETLKLILNHSKGDIPIKSEIGGLQEETELVFADKVAYVAHDISDAFRNGYLDKESIPDCIFDLAKIENRKDISPGRIHNSIVKYCINSAIIESLGMGYFSFCESDTAKKFKQVREWMFENVYYKIDHSYHEKMLNIVHDFLEATYPGIDPLFIMLFMVDWDTARIFDNINHNIKDLTQFGFDETIKEFPKDNIREFDFFKIDMEPEKFSKKII